MSVVCEICGKKPVSGHNVSHSHLKTKRRWLPNVQKTTIMVEGKEKKIKACAKCIKTQSKIRTKKSAQ